LALAASLAEPATTYLEPDGAVQRAVRRALAEAVELPPEALIAATDGCSAPNYALPLRHLAIGFKNLARAGTPSALSRIRDAMLAHPELVSGEGRLDHDLALAYPGRVVNKSGAEAVLALGFREPSLGIAIKVLDGSPRALGPILVETLKQLGLAADLSLLPTLARHERPSVENARKLVTGEIRPSFRLR
jgi:L-asparaginase II